MSSGILFPFPELVTSRAFPARDFPGQKQSRKGRGWGREPKVDGEDRPVVNAKGEVVTESYGGHIEYHRADKYALDRRVSPLCKSIIEHIIGETHSAPPPRPEFADVEMHEWRKMTGKSQRAVEMAIAEGVACGIIERQSPGKRYDKGGYKVRLDRIQGVPLLKPRQPKAQKVVSASLLGPREQAALRIRPAKTAGEREQQVAQLELKIAEIRGLDAKKGEPRANASAQFCAPGQTSPILSVNPVDNNRNFSEAAGTPINGESGANASAQFCAPGPAHAAAESGLTHAAAAGSGAQSTAQPAGTTPVAHQTPPQTSAHAVQTQTPAERPQPGALFPQISVPGPQTDGRTSAKYCPWDWDCPYLISNKQETVVSECVGSRTEEPLPHPPTRLQAIHDLLAGTLAKRLLKKPDQDICIRTDTNLKGAPLEHLHVKIGQRFAAITSYGFVADLLAKDVGDVWADEQARQKPAAAKQEVVRCALCGGSGFPGAVCDSLGDARHLLEGGAKLCDCEAGTHWRRMIE
jgi:hypothetical protein